MTEAPVSIMKPMRWPSIRPSVAKWPRASWGTLRLREAAWPVLSGIAAKRTDGVAEAGAGAILSASCAMKVPRPIMIAAKIIMLRITPLSIADPADFTMVVSKLRPAAIRAGGNFGEKDERTVNKLITGGKHRV